MRSDQPNSTAQLLDYMRAQLDALQLRPLAVSHSEAYGVVEQWSDDDGIHYGRDLAEYIGAEGDETAKRFTELIVVALNALPMLLDRIEKLEEGQYGA